MPSNSAYLNESFPNFLRDVTIFKDKGFIEAWFGKGEVTLPNQRQSTVSVFLPVVLFDRFLGCSAIVSFLAEGAEKPLIRQFESYSLLQRFLASHNVTISLKLSFEELFKIAQEVTNESKKE